MCDVDGMQNVCIDKDTFAFFIFSSLRYAFSESFSLCFVVGIPVLYLSLFPTFLCFVVGIPVLFIAAHVPCPPH
jgi:hypothetical protein